MAHRWREWKQEVDEHFDCPVCGYDNLLTYKVLKEALGVFASFFGSTARSRPYSTPHRCNNLQCNNGNRVTFYVNATPVDDIPGGSLIGKQSVQTTVSLNPLWPTLAPGPVNPFAWGYKQKV